MRPIVVVCFLRPRPFRIRKIEYNLICFAWQSACRSPPTLFTLLPKVSPIGLSATEFFLITFADANSLPNSENVPLRGHTRRTHFLLGPTSPPPTHTLGVLISVSLLAPLCLSYFIDLLWLNGLDQRHYLVLLLLLLLLFLFLLLLLLIVIVPLCLALSCVFWINVSVTS